MNCPKCGNDNPDNAFFCSECGTKLPVLEPADQSSDRLIPPSPAGIASLTPPNPVTPPQDHRSIPTSEQDRSPMIPKDQDLSTYVPNEPTRSGSESDKLSLPSWVVPAIIGFVAILLLTWFYWPEKVKPLQQSELEIVDPSSDIQQDEVSQDQLDQPLILPDKASTPKTENTPGLKEWKRAKMRFDAAFSRYTKLVTEGGDGSVEDALLQYKLRYAELQAIEEKWGIHPAENTSQDLDDIPGIVPID